MDEQIISAIEQRTNDNPGYKPNEKIYGQIRANAKTFESMSQSYSMNISFNDENTCTVQFTSGEKTYMTYTFFNVIIPDNQKSK